MNETVVSAFVVIASLVIIAQAVVLTGLYFSFQKTSRRVEDLTQRLEEHALPVLVSTRQLLEQNGPRIQEITGNMLEITGTMRRQVQRMDATVNDVLDRAHLQVIRADELAGRTMDRVEETTDLLQKTIVTPVRQFSAVLHGISVGLGTLLGRKVATPQELTVVEDEEMFI